MSLTEPLSILIVNLSFVCCFWVKLLRFYPLKCKYFLLSFLLHENKLNVFVLWTKQDTPSWALRNTSAFFAIFWHFIDRTTRLMIEKINNNEKMCCSTFCVSTFKTKTTPFQPPGLVFQRRLPTFAVHALWLHVHRVIVISNISHLMHFYHTHALQYSIY